MLRKSPEGIFKINLNTIRDHLVHHNTFLTQRKTTYLATCGRVSVTQTVRSNRTNIPTNPFISKGVEIRTHNIWAKFDDEKARKQNNFRLAKRGAAISWAIDYLRRSREPRLRS